MHQLNQFGVLCIKAATIEDINSLELEWHFCQYMALCLHEEQPRTAFHMI
jgi:hypothetical protein